MKIYYVHSGYPEIRNFLYIEKIKNHIFFKKKVDFFKLLTYLQFKIFNKISLLLLNLHFSILYKKEIYHFFNGISLINTPWITTFETFIPRFGGINSKYERIGVTRLAHPSCIRLIALSECTKTIQLNFLKQYYPSYLSIISNKMEVIHPSQELHVNHINEKELLTVGKPMIFTFVGNQFFGKGGREILYVFAELQKQGYSFILNIISNLSPDNYASYTTNKDIEELRSLIEDFPENIKFWGLQNNTTVINLLKRTNVGLLPTYADTYGYFVLEAQSCGCPVITTNIRALPEINNENCGWVIEVPIDELRNGLLKEESERIYFSDILKKGLMIAVKEALDNPQLVRQKGELAIERIKKYHSPEQQADTIIAIYNEAINNKNAVNTSKQI